MTDLAQAAALHRQAAALATAADRAGVGADELPAVRVRLLEQQSRFAEVAARDGVSLPPLVPTPGEVAIATPALGDLSPTSVAQAVRSMLSTLDTADQVLGAPALTGAPGSAPLFPPAPPPGATPSAPLRPGATPSATAPPGAPPSAPTSPEAALATPVGLRVRNALVYAGFALSVTLAQIFLFLVFNETQLPKLGWLCLVVLPAFSWLAGYLTITMAFPADAKGKVVATPRLGAIINLLPLALMLALVVILFIASLT